MNKIVFELCAEDRARLDAIIAGLQNLAAGGAAAPAPLPPAMMDKAFERYLAQQDQTARARKIAEAAGIIEHPADASTAHLEPPVAAPAASQPEPAAVEPAPEVKPVSLGEFQKAIVTRCAESAAMKAKVQALVHKYAPSVSEIPEGKRSEVLAELAKL